MEEWSEEEWLEEEFILQVEKKKGRDRTLQKYIGSKEGLLTAIHSMIERLLSEKIVTVNEINIAINTAIEIANKNNEEEN